MNPFEIGLVCSPVAFAEFTCLGADCPQSCCSGWNIPVDSEHATFYRNLPDMELRQELIAILRTVTVRKQESHFLRLTDQAGGICPLTDSHGLCRIQQRLNHEALCHTCYFFPRQFWKVGSEWFMNPSLACPEAVRRIIMNQTPIGLHKTQQAIDPEYDWLDPENLSDPLLQAVYTGRSVIIQQLMHTLQQEEFEIDKRVYQASLLLLQLADKPEILMNPDFEKQIETLMNQVPINYPPAPQNRNSKIYILNHLFNWGLEISSDASKFVHSSLIQMIAPDADIFKKIAENIAQAEIDYLRPYQRQNPHYFENFLSLFVFSEMFRQFGMANSNTFSAKEILRYEAALLPAVYTLFKFTLTQTFAQAGYADDDLFMRAVCAFGKHILHYPHFLRQSIERVQDFNVIDALFNQE